MEHAIEIDGLVVKVKDVRQRVRRSCDSTAGWPKSCKRAAINPHKLLSPESNINHIVNY